MEGETIVGAVRLMREIRDWVNREIEGMTFEEQQRWMQEQLAERDDSTGASQAHSCARDPIH